MKSTQQQRQHGPVGGGAAHLAALYAAAPPSRRRCASLIFLLLHASPRSSAQPVNACMLQAWWGCSGGPLSGLFAAGVSARGSLHDLVRACDAQPGCSASADCACQTPEGGNSNCRAPRCATHAGDVGAAASALACMHCPHPLSPHFTCCDTGAHLQHGCTPPQCASLLIATSNSAGLAPQLPSRHAGCRIPGPCSGVPPAGAAPRCALHRQPAAPPHPCCSPRLLRRGPQAQ